MQFDGMETPTDDVNGVATKTSDGAPTVRKSIFGVDEQGCSEKTSNDHMETLPEAPDKSLDGEQPAPSSDAPQEQLEALVKVEAVLEDTKVDNFGGSSREHETKDTPEAHTANPGEAEGSRDNAVTLAKAITEDSVQTDGVGDDNWLDDWDLTVRRCTKCNRAFATQQRLTQHISRWHAPDSEPLAPHLGPKAPESEESFGVDTLIKIVEDGDLILDAWSESNSHIHHKRFLVASQALWAVSPVFKAMFGPKSQFQEGLNIRRASIFGYPTPVIELEDDPDAMECILKILFHRRPSTVATFQEILNIAIVTDKYEMQDVMAGWAEKVMPTVNARADLAGHEDALFIAWVFEYSDIFERVFTALTLDSYINTNNQLTLCHLVGPCTTLCENTPSIIIDKLIDIRAKRVNIMRARIVSHHTSHVKFAPTLFSTLSFCLGSDELTRPHCHALQTGHFIQNYHSLQLGNEKRWSGWTVRQLSNNLQALQPLVIPHKSCPSCTVSSCPCKGKTSFDTTRLAPVGRTSPPHANCSWVPQVRDDAAASLLPVDQYTVKLSDFPSRK